MYSYFPKTPDVSPIQSPSGREPIPDDRGPTGTSSPIHPRTPGRRYSRTRSTSFCKKTLQPPAVMNQSKSQNLVLHQKMTQNRNLSKLKTHHTTSSTEPGYITGQGESGWCAPATSATASRSLHSSMYSDTTQATTTISWLSRIAASSGSVGSIPVCHEGISGWEAAEPTPQWDHGEFELIDITVAEGDLPILTEADVLSDLGGTSPDDLILLNKVKSMPAWHRWKFINYSEVEIAHWGNNCFVQQLHEDLVRKNAEDPCSLGRPLIIDGVKTTYASSNIQNADGGPDKTESRGKRPHRSQVNILKGSRQKTSPPGRKGTTI